ILGLLLLCGVGIYHKTSPVKFIGDFFFERSLQRSGPVSTFRRVCTSKHLPDLQWLASLVIAVWICGLYILYYKKDDLNKYGVLELCLGGLTGAMATALTWAYQTGLKRLGVVDLFGCEISVICRVCLVVDFATVSVTPRVFHADAKPREFTSEEHYT